MSLASRFRAALHMRCPGWGGQAALARACGVKEASVSSWLTGVSKTLKAAPALKAAEFLGVSPIWLITGEGPMRPEQDHDVMTAAQALKRLSPELRRQIMTMIISVPPEPRSSRREQHNNAHP